MLLAVPPEDMYMRPAELTVVLSAVPLERMCIFGDRLYTDIALGKRYGVSAVLVLTGETTEADVEAADDADKPDFVFDSLDDVNKAIFS